MELEIRQTLSGNRHTGRISPRAFLTSMSPVMSRDAEVFMKAAAAVCQLESSGGRTFVVLSKEKEKDKEKSKVSGVELGVSSTECVRIPENKTHDGPAKCSKGHKRIPASLTMVIDHLLEIVMKFPSPSGEDNCTNYPSAMEVDEPATKVKGKSKVDEAKKIESDSQSERSVGLAKCNPGFIASIVLLVTHVYCGVGDVKRNRNVGSGSTNQRYIAPPPDEATIATIVEMGFGRARAEEALRRVETNSVEMAMEWLFSHVEDPVQEDDELARALALSLGSSSETSKVENIDKSIDTLKDDGRTKEPPVDDILAATMKLFESSDWMAFPLTDLLVTLCSRNKGEDRPRVISYLIQQLKLCPLEFSKDASALCMISHTLALLLSEDGSAREIVAKNGIANVAIDILMNFKARTESGNEPVVPKCVSALLLILDNLLQSRPRISADITEGTPGGPLPDSSGEHVSLSVSEAVKERNPTPAAHDKDSTSFERIFGNSTGYLTVDESRRVLVVACDLIRQHVPAMVMQSVLQLCARLTKTFSGSAISRKWRLGCSF
ncbi:unnamed protein product [Ilex paraguariensis]|uniref:UBA domain-containing protein n=1 Tax=Ilex paraguariensis TaxID=185542 RepID=A0ABC8RJG2_9AQUA